ncbi:hypothetical protein Tamer19_16520 [Cupriavidus sp. TA19]|uniref:hypothetical protein n=1 Tax=unclassified Cupriavidus TaxID=2640874 RepID=UPI0027294D00|nr:hypothetical protein [Cupriavidus sp. TA19]GLC92244.1 hypothetical protein Tamer19_16520 [Cupriavidus sp. TA19]
MSLHEIRDVPAPIPCRDCYIRALQRARLMPAGGRLSDYCEHMSGGVLISATVEHGAIVSWQYAAPCKPPEADADIEGGVSRAAFRKLGRHAA